VDLEVINPIESKTILGCDWYNGRNGGWFDNGDGITIISNGSSNDNWQSCDWV